VSSAPQRLVVVGASWGGLDAIGRLLSALPPSFRSPIVVVQHRGPGSVHGAMRHYLGARTSLEVVDVEDKEPIEDGKVYLAPPDYHLLVDEGMLALSLEAPVSLSRPSVDVLFASAADSYGPALTAVVLTGANNDGSQGSLAVKQAGGTVLVQDPDDAERREMPDAVIATGAADGVYPIEQLAARLAEMECEHDRRS
jgi:two-component system chemotaxis response regulator CheB